MTQDICCRTPMLSGWLLVLFLRLLGLASFRPILFLLGCGIACVLGTDGLSLCSSQVPVDNLSTVRL